MPPTPSSTRESARLRVLTYNILLGGERREDRVAAVLERAGADVIALQEASNLSFVRGLAERLSMRMVVGKPTEASRLNLAVLSRVPVTRWRNHRHPGRMLRTHLECEVELHATQPLRIRVHCVHLAARFGERANGEERRIRELEAILGDIERSGHAPHLVMGDFNSIAPDDQVAATRFFARMAELRRAGLLVRGPDGLTGPLQRRHRVEKALDEAWLAAGMDPSLDVGVPRLPWMIGPLTGVLPRLPITDRVLNRFVERWTVARMLSLGYTDCYRRLHPAGDGYTCATWMPAARIDYIFADAAMARRLRRCEVVGSDAHPDPDAATASDHFPLVADFRV